MARKCHLGRLFRTNAELNDTNRPRFFWPHLAPSTVPPILGVDDANPLLQVSVNKVLLMFRWSNRSFSSLFAVQVDFRHVGRRLVDMLMVYHSTMFPSMATELAKVELRRILSTVLKRTSGLRRGACIFRLPADVCFPRLQAQTVVDQPGPLAGRVSPKTHTQKRIEFALVWLCFFGEGPLFSACRVAH